MLRNINMQFDPSGDSRETRAALSTVVTRKRKRAPEMPAARPRKRQRTREADDNEEGIAGVRRLLADMKRRGITRADVAHAFKMPTNPKLDQGDSAGDAIDLTDE